MDSEVQRSRARMVVRPSIQHYGATSVPKKKDKQDEAIIGTNDYSIVSKRSVEKLYHPDEPEFFRSFIGKFKRRSPLINRGYWLRMKAIEQVIKNFLDEPTAKSKTIINLGCGYEPLPFRMLWKYRSQCHNVKFIDIDFPQLIERKLQIIQSSTIYTDLLSASGKETLLSFRESDHFDDEHYCAVGCDLGDISRIRDTLLSQLHLQGHAILFLAEVSMVYMESQPATNLIHLCGEFEDARFCMLEQHLPEGEAHPFATTMIDHFNKQTPLRVLNAYPTMESQRRRFQEAKWSTVRIRDLWSLWQDDFFLDQSTKSALNEVEPFDEWEELALFAGHYFLLSATTREATSFSPPFLSENLRQPDRLDPKLEVPQSEQIEIMRRKNPKTYGLRRFGAVLDMDREVFALHGGVVSSAKQDDLDIYSRSDTPMETNHGPESLMCHTITKLGDKSVLLVGGRRSPGCASCRCYILETGVWARTHGLPFGRYRHCSVAVMIGFVPSVLTFGGRSSAGDALDEWLLFDRDEGWRAVPSDVRIPGVFGAAMITTERNTGILVGGMTTSGTMISQYWRWELVETMAGELKVECKQILAPKPEGGMEVSGISRFGASLVRSRWGLVLIGGIGPRGVLQIDDEIIFLGADGAIQHSTGLSELLKSSGPRPLLIGHAAQVVDGGDVMIVGGGGVCFSFGAFWNESYYVIRVLERKIIESETSKIQRILEQRDQSSGEVIHNQPTVQQVLDPSQVLKHATPIPQVEIMTSDDFSSLVSSAKPIIIQNSDLGPCRALWTPQYLKETVGPDRSVVVHSSSEPHLSFFTKNFAYETQPFSTFIDAAMNGSLVYLRALSSENPSKEPASLQRDFPGIAKDFVLPPALKLAAENEHSSVLRISGKITMWLHYDVMANILCQIRGSKKVFLFPPADISHLKFVHGETTSGLNIFTAKEEVLKNTHPVETILEEGQVLFIPACWAHATAPVGEGGSVAINVFFKSFSDSAYAAGRDVYGNRDLEVYQNGRRDIDRIMKMYKTDFRSPEVIKEQIMLLVGGLRKETLGWKACKKGSKEVLRVLGSVEGLPEDVGKFYLDRLADELGDFVKIVPFRPRYAWAEEQEQIFQ